VRDFNNPSNHSADVEFAANNSEFLEERLAGLKRWMNIVALHPILSQDPITNFFLTYSGPKVNTKILEVYKRMPDEFTTSDIASKSKVVADKINYCGFLTVFIFLGADTSGQP
jgi:PX domain